MLLFFLLSICTALVSNPSCHAQAPVELPNFPINCDLVAALRPGWNPLDERANGNNGVFHTLHAIEWNDFSNQAFPGQTLVYKFVTRKYQHWNVSYTDYQLHYNIELKGCVVIPDSTSPTGYWEYWGFTIPHDYPLDWSEGRQGVIGHEWFYWHYGPVDYPSFQPTVMSRVEILPLNITGSDEPITCPEETYVCTAIGEIGWKYDETTHQNTTIQGLQQQCYSVALGDLNGCQTWMHHNRHFPDPNEPTDAPTVPPPEIPIVARACGTDDKQLCTNGKCVALNETCEQATTCAETKDCPVGQICRSSDYTDANSYARTCQYVNKFNYCPKFEREPWTQAKCDQQWGNAYPYKGWSPCDVYINTTYHDGCRLSYCHGDCSASYLIISCEDMFNGTIMACPWGTSPGYSPFVSGQCICSDSWETLGVSVNAPDFPNSSVTLFHINIMSLLGAIMMAIIMKW